MSSSPASGAPTSRGTWTIRKADWSIRALEAHLRCRCSTTSLQSKRSEKPPSTNTWQELEPRKRLRFTKFVSEPMSSINNVFQALQDLHPLAPQCRSLGFYRFPNFVALTFHRRYNVSIRRSQMPVRRTTIFHCSFHIYQKGNTSRK